MVYSWKVSGLYNVSAQDAGEELDRISEERGLTAQAVVDESRDEHAVLHCCFDWNDDTAAESWRREQARHLIACVTVKDESIHPTEPVRLYVSVQERDTYKPIKLVISDEEMRARMIKNALRELIEFKHKYKVLMGVTESPLKEVLEALAD